MKMNGTGVMNRTINKIWNCIQFVVFSSHSERMWVIFNVILITDTVTEGE